MNAHDAYDAAKAYFKGMDETVGSACAGIAIFKSHLPYADAYRIAEQCCETGKQLMKEHLMGEVNLMDFHYCQGAIGTDIEKIRKWETGGIISKPWFVEYDGNNVGKKNKSEIVTFKMVDSMVQNLNTCSRTNIKGLLECARNSESELYTELTRMQLRRKNASALGPIDGIIDCEGNKISLDLLRRMVFDIVSVYDLWFRK